MKNVLKWLDRNLEKSIMLVLLIVINKRAERTKND